MKTNTGVECLLCHGTGRLFCDACGGAGTSAMLVRDDERQRCPHCSGRRVVPCSRCAGTGCLAVSVAWETV